ncbi:MAG TPA: biopolymer transporter ExbD [Opitutaceae bacterium]|nr:biopolymer transporter ExbD [Opitutaceae bacterium]
MARIFHRRRQLAPVAELNVTNLIDLGFTLLIIFMIATPLIQQSQSIPLDLPVQSSQAQPKTKEQAQLIAVDRNGNYYWGSNRTSLAQIRVNLQALAELPKPPVIRIEADFSLQYQQVVTVLDEVKKVGLSKISLETQMSK